MLTKDHSYLVQEMLYIISYSPFFKYWVLFFEFRIFLFSVTSDPQPLCPWVVNYQSTILLNQFS